MLSMKFQAFITLEIFLTFMTVGCTGTVSETGTSELQLSSVATFGRDNAGLIEIGPGLNDGKGIGLGVVGVDSPVPVRVTLENYERQYEREIEIFEEQEIENPSPKGSIVFTGSSSIRMWKTLKDDMAPWPAINRGFGGSTLRQVNAYAERIIFPLEPSLIVLYCGENDIAMAKQNVEETYQDFLDLIKLFRYRMPNTSILYISMKPSISRWSYWEQYETGNERIKDFCDKKDYLTFIDVGPAMLDDNGRPRPELFVRDKLHMNALGYKEWTRLIRREVEACDKIESRILGTPMNK